MGEVLKNQEIKAKKVRVIDEQGENLGIFLLEEALKLAQEKNLDLILVAPQANPPVCKIADYGKYLYQLKKKERQKKKHKGGEVKVIRLGFQISDHDLEFRANQAKEFLKEGFRVKIELPLRGRENKFKDLAKEKIKKFIQLLAQEFNLKAEEIKSQGRNLITIITKS